MRKHIRTGIEILLLCLLVAVGVWQFNVQYQSGYVQGATDGRVAWQSAGYAAGKTDGLTQGHAQGYSDGFTSGKATGQAQQLAALENWLQSVGCETTYSGYIYFKMYQDAGGVWQYTCLVLT